MPIEWWAFTKTAVDEQWPPITSITLQYCDCENPRPPNSRGAVMPRTPIRPRPSITLGGMSASRSMAAASIDDSAKARTSAHRRSASACLSGGSSGYGWTDEARYRPLKRALANPSLCGPEKSSSSAWATCFARSGSFIGELPGREGAEVDMAAASGRGEWTILAGHAPRESAVRMRQPVARALDTARPGRAISQGSRQAVSATTH